MVVVVDDATEHVSTAYGAFRMASRWRDWSTLGEALVGTG